MANILIHTSDERKALALQSDLRQEGHIGFPVLHASEMVRALGRNPDLAIIDLVMFHAH
jgi:DNA-binding response OmpR family regulator